jgi:hypothetical protein
VLGLDTAGHPAALPTVAEQGKPLRPLAFMLAERDKSMSEQNRSFMQELSQWIDDNVIYPLHFGDSPEDPHARSPEEIADQGQIGYPGESPGELPQRRKSRPATGQKGAPAMNWRKFYQLLYTALIGFETGFIIDLIRGLRRNARNGISPAQAASSLFGSGGGGSHPPTGPRSCYSAR